MSGYKVDFFFTGWGLHYCRDFSGGVFQAMKKDMDVNMTPLLARGVI